MLLTDPFGFASSVTSPVGVDVAEDHLPVRLEPLDDVGLGVVVAFAVRDRNPQHLAGSTRRA